MRATRDGALVLFHDETLERLTGDPRPLAKVTLADLAALRVRGPEGTLARIPTLREAIEAINGRCAIEIDLPARGLEEAIIDVVRTTGAEPWTWFTRHPPEDALALRTACPQARVFLSVAPRPTRVRDLADGIEVASRLGLHGVNPTLVAVLPSHVEAAHERGLLIGVWTVNTPAAIERALDLGVDAVTTDVPARVAEAVARREPNPRSGGV